MDNWESFNISRHYENTKQGIKRDYKAVKGASVKASVVALREQHPDWEVPEIAAMVGVSPSWVSKILRAAGLARGRRGPQKGETAIRVIALREQNPDWEIREIATRVGVSGERVCQILKAARARTRAYRPPQTVECANEGCANRCPRSQRDNARTCCSLECRRATSSVAVCCSHCGAEKIVPRNHYNRAEGLTRSGGRYKGRFFCDRTCSGAYAGKNYGWGSEAIANQRAITRCKASLGKSRAAMLRRVRGHIAKLEGEIARFRDASPELGDCVGYLEKEKTRLEEATKELFGLAGVHAKAITPEPSVSDHFTLKGTTAAGRRTLET
jgi:hypothetical protein